MCISAPSHSLFSTVCNVTINRIVNLFSNKWSKECNAIKRISLLERLILNRTINVDEYLYHNIMKFSKLIIHAFTSTGDHPNRHRSLVLDRNYIRLTKYLTHAQFDIAINSHLCPQCVDQLLLFLLFPLQPSHDANGIGYRTMNFIMMLVVIVAIEHTVAVVVAASPPTGMFVMIGYTPALHE